MRVFKKKLTKNRSGTDGVRNASSRVGSNYYYYRDNTFQSNFDKAVRFYMLRQLSFSGMLRFDSNGSYNIPFGWYKKLKRIEEKEADIKRVFGNTTLLNEDWQSAVKNATKDDFVFLDPPYTRRFQKYHPNGEFGQKQHKELAEWFKKTEAKCLLIINKDEFTHSLYKDYLVKEYGFKYSIQFRDRMTEKDSNANHIIATNF